MAWKLMDAREIPLEWIVDEYIKNSAPSSIYQPPQKAVREDDEQEFTSTVTTIRTLTSPSSVSHRHHSDNKFFPLLSSQDRSDRTVLIRTSSFPLENMGLVVFSSFLLISMLVTRPLLKRNKRELPKLTTLFRPSECYYI
jgi:hypothetical protein